MFTFEVQDMTCGHCVSSITQAVRALDPNAQVTADLATHRVGIESTTAGGTALSVALREAGYTPVLVDGGPASTPQPAPRSGCCCR
jgi:copper chaperone